MAVGNRAVKVAVLMPSFNYARYLPLAIESVLSQSYSDLELIITDDCSTDGSREIAEQWRRLDDRVVTVFHEVNRGLAATRNSALAVSSGEFVALCDADDIWLADKLKIQLECFRKQPQLGVVHSDAAIMNGDGNLTGQRFSSLFHGKDQKCSGMIFHELCLRNFVCVPTVVLKRECLEFAGGFDERLRSLEDWFCWTRVARGYPFGYVQEPLVKYRIHDSALSRQVRQMVRNRVLAISLILAEHSDIPSKVRSKLLYSMGTQYVYLGDWGAALRSFQDSLGEDIFNLRAWVRCGQVLLERLRHA
jgi:glycosyltransferase involved in cell wall biosynthesis